MLISRIETKRPNESIRFGHIGVVNDNTEDTVNEEVKQRAGVMESYISAEENGKTQLTVDMDITEEYKTIF